MSGSTLGSDLQMNVPKVSVIIPVYNVETYIERCVHSLFGQTLDSMEFIFVDDCSPDRSIDIIKEIIEKYPSRKAQTKIIRHASNNGVSQSRQDGLKMAAGEYIIHCDPDDYVEETMYETLYFKAKETDADIVICDYIKRGDKDIYCSAEPEELSSISLVRQMSGMSKQYIIGATWNKLIKARLANKGSFTPGVSYCEDTLYLFELLKDEVKIEYVQQALYNYCVSRTDSLVRTVNKKIFKSDLLLFEKLESLGAGNKYSERCYESFLGSVVLDRFFSYEPGDDISSISILKQYKKYIFLPSRYSMLKKVLVYGALTVNYRFFKEVYKILSKIR